MSSVLDLGDLVEGQLDRGLALEDRDQHLEVLGIDLDLGDRGGRVSNGPFLDDDRLADLEVDDGDLGRSAACPRPWSLRPGGASKTGASMEKTSSMRQRHRLVGVAHEAGHPGCGGRRPSSRR